MGLGIGRLSASFRHPHLLSLRQLSIWHEFSDFNLFDDINKTISVCPFSRLTSSDGITLIKKGLHANKGAGNDFKRFASYSCFFSLFFVFFFWSLFVFVVEHLGDINRCVPCEIIDRTCLLIVSLLFAAIPFIISFPPYTYFDLVDQCVHGVGFCR